MQFQLLRNRISTLPFAIFIVVLLIYPALQRKIQIGLWHLWHGNTTMIGNYEIPVPMNLVAHKRSEEIVALLDVNNNQIRGAIPTMILITKVNPQQDLDYATSIEEQSLRSQGAQVFDRRTIEFDGGKAICVRSNMLTKDIPVLNDSVVSISCATTTELSVMFNGKKESVDNFYLIVSQIRKISTGSGVIR